MSTHDSPAKAVADVTRGMLLAAIEIAAPPERVFQAVTSDELVRWWGSADTYRTTRWTGDVRVGGAWRADYAPNGGRPFSTQGEFQELDAPRLFVQTWRYVDADWDPSGRVTTITWRFEPTETGTRVLVRHEGFGDAHASCDNHAAGWERVLGWLAEHIADARRRAADLEALGQK
ncbi:MAG TPA: SRPBCC domain-containing protein [Polyangiaceae bacterium]